jgi:hypothetical protein
MGRIYSYTEKTTPAGTDEFIFQETSNGITKKITHANFLKSVTDDITAIQAQLGNVKTLTASDSPYTIGDTDGDSRYLIDPSGGDVSITMPTLAANLSKTYFFTQISEGGRVTIDGEGAETIGGSASIYFQGKNDRLRVTGHDSEWSIDYYYAHYDTGWQNRSDWTAVQIGTSTFDYDGATGTATIGGVVTDGTVSGIIQSDSNPGGAAGTFVVKNISGGTGLWTNDAAITATGGWSGLVNEPAGNNKNQDTDIFHEYGKNDLALLSVKMIISTDKTSANAFRHSSGGEDGSSDYGFNFRGVDANNLYTEWAKGGIKYIDTAGDIQTLDTEDWYYRIIVEVFI